MGAYKRIKTNISETILNIREVILNIREVILIGFIVIYAGLSIYLVNDNEKLLKQVDYVMGKYNEVNYQADLINNAYEELKEKYEYAIEVIRTSDKYDLPEGVNK